MKKRNATVKPATVKPVVNAVQQAFGSTDIRKSINRFADGQMKLTKVMETTASDCNLYFTTTFGGEGKRWFKVDTKDKKNPLAQEVLIIREYFNNTLKERLGADVNARVYWQRLTAKAFELAFPAEYEAEKKAKAKAKQAEKDADDGTGAEPDTTNADLSPEIMELAKEFADACGWNKSVANRALAMVFLSGAVAGSKA